MVGLAVAVAGIALIAAALLDAFETIVLPRRVSRRLRLARLFYRGTWRPFAAAARSIASAPRREAFLSFYGPLSLLLLVAVWALILIFGFAVLQWGAGSQASGAGDPRGFLTDLYFSGTTFFTVGLGDVSPMSGLARLLTALEGGTGFAFLALLIGYLPIVYQLFARRETNVSLLDQRAGSPPTAAELLRRNVRDGDVSELVRLLRDWETWVADLLESHLSYPTLAYFRSQHENQSWVGALALVLDVSAEVLASGNPRCGRQAGFTFAIARHAVGDLTNVLNVRPRSSAEERLSPSDASALWEAASALGLTQVDPATARARLAAIRQAYEPYIQALADHLLIALPPWVSLPGATDNWETTAWEYDSPIADLGAESPFGRP